MKHYKPIIVAVLIMLLGAVRNASAQSWQITNKYLLQFSCNMTSGIFKDIKASILFDEQSLNTAKFNVNVDVASINTGNAMMNKHAKSDEWLDAVKYPAISFASKKIIKIGASYQVTGDLTVHGVTKEISIPFTFRRMDNSGIFTTNFTINRSDFAIGKPAGEVDEKININLSVPVIKS
jgi:polyisoprenoid-binding protein YceI